MSQKIFAGLDVGSHTIQAVVVQKKNSDQKLRILGVGQVLTQGVRKGVVVDIEEASKSIRLCLDQAEKNSGHKIIKVALSLGSPFISSRLSRGVVAVSRADQEISEEDISRVVKAAEAISLPPNREIIHVIPREFIVDSEGGIRDPLGMRGVRLEVNALIIDGFTPFIRNLLKAVEIAGVKHSVLILSTLAASRSCLSKRQKELGVAILDIGASTTGLSVFEEDTLLLTQILPVGAGHITNDLAIGLRTAIDVAERIKLEYGISLPQVVSKKEIIQLDKFGLEKQVISRKEIASIIEARLLEIFDLVNKELRSIGREGRLPAGVVILGGGTKMPGLVELAKSKLKLPVQIGFPQEGISGFTEKVDDPAFSTAVGLVLWESDFEEKEKGESNILKLFKKWFRVFLP